MKTIFSLGAVGLTMLVVSGPAVGQSLIVPDDTLGEERSQVIENFGGLPAELIQGGAQRGSNLFHSFLEFNIDEGRGAFFFSPDGLENVFSRVTGSNPSNILGVLGTVGDSSPDLYLMNPNGILFGPNSSLAVGGSFAAVTADGIQFGEQGVFSAVAPEVPSDLLTIDPSAFLFSQVPAGQIINQSIARNPTDPSQVIGLSVNPGEQLLLLSQEVAFDGGTLTTFDGRIDVGAVAGVGTVALDSEEGGLIFPETLARGDVAVENGAVLDVRLDGGGDIAITAQDIRLAGSSLLAGIEFDSGSPTSQAGDIILDANNGIEISDSGVVDNSVLTGIGTGGDIVITAGTLDVLSGAQLQADTLGQGDAGNIIINASDRVTFSGRSDDGTLVSAAFSQVFAEAVGSGGNINVTTPTLELMDGAQLVTTTFGEGDVGDVVINARDRIILDDSAIFNQVDPGAVGNGGTINVTTATLEVLNGSQLLADTFGVGDAGSVVINANDIVRLAGISADGSFQNVIASDVQSGAIGNGGNVDITAGRLEILDGSQLRASTFGEGTSGNVIIEAERVRLLDNSVASTRVGEAAFGSGGDINITASVLEVLSGSQLQADSDGNGNAGNVIVAASDRVTFAGASDDGIVQTLVVSRINEGAVGTGGNVDINTAVLEVLDGAQISASTFGQGDAGNVIIDASDRATFAGTSEDGLFISAAFSTVEAEGTGAGGDININTSVLEVLNGAGLTTSTEGRGNAGSIIINASNRAIFAGDDSLTLSAVSETGNGVGGNIDISTAVLEVLDGADLLASTFGQGDAGSITINARNRASFSGDSTVFTTVEETGEGAGGDITVTTTVLEVINGAGLQASTEGKGDAGNIIINARNRASFAESSAAASIVEETGDGTGGSIDITTALLEVRDGSQLSVSTFGRGDAGSITINARNRASFTGNSAASSAIVEPGEGAGGNINITTALLEVLDGASLLARTSGQGDAGNIIINASDRATFAGEREDGQITSAAFTTVGETGEGAGGNIDITTSLLQVQNGAQLQALTRGQGNAGSIIINAHDQAIFASRSQNGQFPSAAFTSATETSDGSGGDVILNTINLILTDGALISAASDSPESAGDIRLNATDTLQLTDSNITTAALQSSGGDILINTAPTAQNALTTLEGDSDITTNSLGNGGNITIGGSAILAFDDSDIISSSGAATGGNITLTRFLSEPTPPGNALDFDGNDQVDVNATGAVASGTITAPDTSFLQNSLADLPEGTLNTESLIANSCVTRNEDGSSTFNITGAEGLRERPGNSTTGYPTGEVQPVPQEQSWQPGDPIVEPQAVYQLPNGELVLSHTCQ